MATVLVRDIESPLFADDVIILYILLCILSIYTHLYLSDVVDDNDDEAEELNNGDKKRYKFKRQDEKRRRSRNKNLHNKNRSTLCCTHTTHSTGKDEREKFWPL
jgi:hypothetical protein